ncbi:hypothetical protein ABT090_20815 [Streptomyces asoensis]|uniref:hypothetical protein n=1 Tax=Streptomyces asoensis TaxID=249586 RepID=UPI0033174820
MTTVNFLLDSVLAVGWFCLALLAAGCALLVFLIGRVAGDAIAARWHARRLIRDVQLYVHRPALRPLYDTHDQPRKEM